MAESLKDGGETKLNELILAIVKQQELGNRVDATRVIAENPELATAIRDYLKDALLLQQALERDSPCQNTEFAAADRTRVAQPSRITDARPSSSDASWSPNAGIGMTPDYATGIRRFGRYEIKGLLGEGGMGSVYLACDTRLNRRVALKSPKFSGSDVAILSERFRREAQTAATLHHRNICPVYDVGQFDGIDYLTMAFVEGRPLSAYISRKRLLPQRQIALIIRKLAIALQEAHRAGVIHRDLKPSNVLIDRSGEPVIMDFGLAGRIDPSGESRLTLSGSIMGTPAYMSPEQIRGNLDEIGLQSDIYSLGTLFFELLTGRLPFLGGPAEVMGMILVARPPKLSDLRTGIDPELERICARMMAKTRQKRYASMKDVADDLTDVIRRSRLRETTKPANPSNEDDADSRQINTAHDLAAIAKIASAAPRSRKWRFRAFRKKNNSQRMPGTAANHTGPAVRKYVWLMSAGALLAIFFAVIVTIKITIDKEGNVGIEVEQSQAQDDEPKSVTQPVVGLTLDHKKFKPPVGGRSGATLTRLQNWGPNGEFFHDPATGLYWVDPHVFVGWTFDEIDRLVKSNSTLNWATGEQIDALLGKPAENDVPLTDVLGPIQFRTQSLQQGNWRSGFRWVGYVGENSKGSNGWGVQTGIGENALTTLTDSGHQGSVENWKHGAWINSTSPPDVKLSKDQGGELNMEAGAPEEPKGNAFSLLKEPTESKSNEPKPDLVISAASVTKVTSNRMEYTCTVRNIGNTPVTASGIRSILQAYCSDDELLDDLDPPAGGTTFYCSGLAPGAERDIRFSFFPRLHHNRFGKPYVIFVLDSPHNERSMDNNTYVLDTREFRQLNPSD